ncbi:DUF1127 domain-containing protein [Methylobacterium sp. J-090]|uniref:DUF1127 domain-containing protein n=1 Tax=Methylobacterium sp. J-090 TaxID=2836666 RepID=UPI001FBB3C68|nr:DUF1127 domain-containing protein [Methylobacterium sp. J-090]MCJ2083101.1 DUF1127 domain-containing protein [Methylobacterium sp. J-090]
MTGTTIRDTERAELPLPFTRLRRARGYVVTLLASVASGLSRAAINARVLRQLGAMSERELKDIGLVRQDLADAIALRLDGDATNLLLARRDERKAAQRRKERT